VMPLSTKLPATAFSEAHELARQNAVKMLGLPETNTAMDRAKAMGFDVDTPVYHGTTNDFLEPNTASRAFYATDDPEISNIYAMAEGRHKGLREVNAGANVIPLIGKKNLLTVSDIGPDGHGWISDNIKTALGLPPETSSRQLYMKANDAGYDGLKMTDYSDLGGDNQTQYVFPLGKNIRSRFAAFDPAKANSANILASLLLGAPALKALYSEDKK